MGRLEGQKVAVMGGDGFLGSRVVEFVKSREGDATSITRANYADLKGSSFDFFINANGNSKRFWANQNPEKDFEASFKRVEDSLRDFDYHVYFYFSSSDVYLNHGDPGQTIEGSASDPAVLEPYGRHKRMAELIVEKLPRRAILRLSAMVGTGLRKGVIKDILDGNALRVTPESHLQFITTDAVCEVLEKVVTDAENAILNVGGRGSIAIPEIEKIFGKAKYGDELQLQEYEMDVGKLAKIYPIKTSREYLTIYKETL